MIFTLHLGQMYKQVHAEIQEACRNIHIPVDISKQQHKTH